MIELVETERGPRPSATDRFLACASSAMTPLTPHDPDSVARLSGTAVHTAIEQTIDTGASPDIEALAYEHGVEDVAEVAIPYALWRRAWAHLERYFPEPRTEVHVEGALTAGTLDLLSCSAQRISFADWKSGRATTSHIGQMTAYAHCLRSKYGMPDEGVIRGAVVHLRHQYWDVQEFDDARLDAFEARYLAQVKRIGEHYAAGEHCGFCPRRMECPTRASYVRGCLAAIADAAEVRAPGAVLAQLYPQYKAAKAALDDYNTALRAELSEGPLPVDDENELYLQERVRQKIDARRAWPILREQMTDDELAGAVTIAKGAVMAVIRGAAPRGQKGVVTKNLIERLKQEGAIEEHPQVAVATRRKEG